MVRLLTNEKSSAASVGIKQILLIASFISPFAGNNTALAGKVETVTIQIATKGDEIAFDKSVIDIPFGRKLKLVFVNKAAKDSQIDHNIAILQPGSIDKVIAELQKKGYDLSKVDKKLGVLLVSKTIKPGESTTIEFSPDAPGIYPFMCSMAGHGDMLQMQGTLHFK